MKNSYLKYLFILNVIAPLTFPTSPLIAYPNDLIETSVNQSQIDSTHVPQVLKEFVERSIRQGVSVDQIIEQAVKLGHPREQVVSAYSIIMGEEVDDEASSTQNTLMWCVLGAVVVGLGAWLAYERFRSKLIIPQQHLPNLRPGNRRFNIIPTNGEHLANVEIEQLNDFIENGLAAGRNQAELVRVIRQRFPEVPLRFEFRNVENAVYGYDEYYAWNQDPYRDQ